MSDKEKALEAIDQSFDLRDLTRYVPCVFNGGTCGETPTIQMGPHDLCQKHAVQATERHYMMKELGLA